MSTSTLVKFVAVLAGLLCLVSLAWVLSFGFTFPGSSWELTGWSAPGGSPPVPAVKAIIAAKKATGPSSQTLEPEYQSAPYYCRLAFGPKREHLVLTAADLKADTLYVDLNSNGDLTEPNEAFEIVQTIQFKQTRYLSAVIPEVAAGDNTHTELTIKYGQTGDEVKGVFAIKLWGWSDSTTDADLVPFEMSNKSDEVPLLHFDGPLTMGNYRKVVEMQRGEEVKFYSLVGTPGESGGTLTAIANTQITDDAHPKVEFEFPHEDSTKPAIKVKSYLEVRC